MRVNGVDMAKLKIAVAGSGGRMGRALLEAVLGCGDAALGAALEIAGSPYIGKDAGELVGAPGQVTIGTDVDKGLAGCDVLIDFTRPEATLVHVAACRKLGVKLVIGTTGFDEAQKKAITDAARDIAIVMAPNMSIGTNLVFKLADVAARALKDGYDVEIIEAHHRHKIDAPSGTALHIGNIIANAQDKRLADCAVHGREGVTGERKAQSIGFSAVRGGDIVGEHTVMFAGAGERVEIIVRSSSRATYALGALRAAQFLASKKNGLYDMQDVLGLR
jgi:4-hydroxy-tetrahydrodipicolinate reductase